MLSRKGTLFKGLQRRFRTRRFKLVQEMIEQALEGRDQITVLDAGGRARYWEMLPMDLRKKVHITCMNYDRELKAFDVGKESGLRVENVVGNACEMPHYGDRSFDLVHSNSVIEHVGSYGNMVRFADEIRRVGKSYYVQTPNFWFLVDPHYGVPGFHWLPDPVKAWLLTKANIGLARKCDYRSALAQIDACRIVSRRLMRNVFPDGCHRSERFMKVFVKSLIVSRGQAAEMRS